MSFGDTLGYPTLVMKKMSFWRHALKSKGANMASINDSFTPCFYLHLSVIHDLGVLIPFTLFKTKVLVIESVS